MFVDLGLSVKWADCNIGAEQPKDFGHYLNFDEATETPNLPTYEQWKELQKNCVFTFIKELNGVNATGPNGNSIFLPFACEKNGHYDEKHPGAFFWTSKEDDVEKDYAYYAGFSKATYGKQIKIGTYLILKRENLIPIRTVLIE